MVVVVDLYATEAVLICIPMQSSNHTCSYFNSSKAKTNLMSQSDSSSSYYFFPCLIETVVEYDIWILLISRLVIIFIYFKCLFFIINIK